jgi:hypothetical protein
MKIELFTDDFAIGELNLKNNRIIYEGEGLTPQDISNAFEEKYNDTVWKTKDDLIHSFLQGKAHYILGLIGYIVKIARLEGYKNILSLGAGQCVCEYLIKISLPDDFKVAAFDYNAFFIRKAKEYFPEIESMQFDFYKDDISSLKDNYRIDFDMAIFINSTYVMDDSSFIKLFSDLKKIGVKKIVNFSTAYLNIEKILKYYLSRNLALRKIFNKGPIKNQNGQFYGYARDRWDLRKLYKESGWTRTKEISFDALDYVAIIS